MSKLILSLVALAALHLELVRLEVLPGTFDHMLRLNAGILFIFILSTLIAYRGLKKDAEQFAWRFLIMTTFQLLGMMTFVIWYSLKYKSESFVLGVSGSLLFLLGLALQSSILIRGIREK